MRRFWIEENLEWRWCTYCVYISFSILVGLPKKVLQMYSDIWLVPDFDSEKWLSSLFSMRLN